MLNGKTTAAEKDGTVKVVVQMIVFTFIIIATFVGNGLICISVVKFRHLRTNTNFILLSLALTDLTMVTIMILNATTTAIGKWIFGEFCCRAIASVGLTLSFISILHMCLLSVDRYIAIQKPLRYQFIVTRRRVLTILLLIWVSVSVTLNIPLADFEFRADTYGCTSDSNRDSSEDSVYIFFLVGLFIIFPFGIIFFSNVVVFKTAFTQARQLSRVERSLRESSANMCEESEPQHSTKTVETHSLKREIKSAGTFALVVGIFLLCYTPFYTAGTYRKIAGPLKVPRNVLVTTMWVGFANSFCNPIVYGLRYSPFRKAFKKLCPLKSKGNRKRNYSYNSSSDRRDRFGTVLSTSSAL